MTVETAMKVVVLGAAGAVAGEVARQLAARHGEVEIVLADRDLAGATKLAEEIAAIAVQVDASDPASLAQVVAGAGLVVNGVGPFHRFGLTVARACVEAGAHYVDVCDEYDVAADMLADAELEAKAKAAGVTVLTGMGSAPGVTNLAAKWAADRLDEAHSAEVVLAVPYVVDLGTTINDHMLHSMSGEVLQHLDGQLAEVRPWESPRRIEFREPFAAVDAGWMGHPEGVTMPRFIDGLKHAAVRFAWFEPEGVELWKTYERLGLCSDEVPEGLSISPRRYLAAYMSSAQGRKALKLKSSRMPGSVWQVRVEGARDGVPTVVEIEGHIRYDRPNRPPAAGLTAIPAALGVLEVLEGRVTRRGVVAPEGCIEAEPFIRAATDATVVEVFVRESSGGGDWVDVA